MMETVKNGFWDYANKWKEEFAGDRPLDWERCWIKNGYCSDCRYCCGPQDSDHPFPMPLLASQGREGLERDFHLLDSLTPYLAAAGCRSCTKTGCRLEPGQKPLACGFFPVVLVNGALYLYQNCPSVLFTPLVRFMELAREVAAFLIELDLDELRRLSLWLTVDTLSRSYINLRIRLFNAQGKKLVFE